MLRLMGQSHDLEPKVERLLYELCVELGFCLPPAESRRLRESPPDDADSFTVAVFEAEGMDFMRYPDLRRQVRQVIGRHMSRW